MTLSERLSAAITSAMKVGDPFRRDTLRLALDAIQKAQKRDRRTYADDEVVGILAHEVKTRRESIEAYRKGGREDLATKEEAEIAVLAEFLPQALTADEVADLVAEAFAATGAAGPRDMGKVMGYLTPRTRGRVDGAALAALVRTKLAD